MKNNILKYSQPAKVWEEALPLGNGEIGAMVYGGVDTEVVRFNCDTFWKGTFSDRQLPADVNDLKKIRQLISERQFDKAMGFANKVYAGNQPNAYIPIGDLIIKRCESGYIEGYERYLDMRNGCITVKCSEKKVKQNNGPALPVDSFGFLRKYLVSKAYKVFICDIKQQGEKPISYSLSFDNDLPSDIYLKNDFLHMHTVAPVDKKEQFSQKRSENTVSGHCILSFKTEGENANIEYFNNKIMIYDAARITIYVSCLTNYSEKTKKPDTKIDLEKECEKIVQNAENAGFDKIFENHTGDFNGLYDRCTLELGEDSELDLNERLSLLQNGQEDLSLVSLMFQYGRYLMISGSWEGSQPLTLQGIWNQRVNPPWNSAYTLNINAEMNYWPAETCNLSECHKPMLNMIDELRESGRRTAKGIYGSNGFCVHLNTDLQRVTIPTGSGAECAMWPTGGLWLARHIWEHYEFTLDEEYLENKAYPILSECVEFISDFLTENKEGFLITSPSSSPENNFIFNDAVCAVTEMSAMDRAMIEEVLRNFIKCCEILKEDNELCRKAVQIIERLLPFKIDSEGRLMEWPEEFCERERGHRHLSHLYSVFPGNVISKETPELFEAARRSLEVRLENGSGYTGWSAAWIMNLYSVFGDGNEAYEMMKKMLINSVYPNLFDAHPPFQIDGNFGFTAAVANMLLKSKTDGNSVEIEIFPAKPDKWQKGKISGIKAKGNISADIEWNNDDVIVILNNPNQLHIKEKISKKYNLKIREISH